MKRDILIYLKDVIDNGVNLERVWLVAKESIPRLKPLILKVLKEYGKIN